MSRNLLRVVGDTMALIVIMAVIFASLTVVNAAIEQSAVMRWPSECIHVQKNTYIEAPVVDGKPDFDHAKAYRFLINESCGVIQINRERASR